MYYCPECGTEFEKPKKSYSSHNLSCPPYEKVYTCPNCLGENFFEKNTTYCRCCGSKLRRGAVEYCSESCKSKGKKLWNKEIKRRQERLTNPINRIVGELEIYNKINSTNYSYGQYIALVLPREGKK